MRGILIYKWQSPREHTRGLAPIQRALHHGGEVRGGRLHVDPTLVWLQWRIEIRLLRRSDDALDDSDGLERDTELTREIQHLLEIEPMVESMVHATGDRVERFTRRDVQWHDVLNDLQRVVGQDGLAKRPKHGRFFLEIIDAGIDLVVETLLVILSSGYGDERSVDVHHVTAILQENSRGGHGASRRGLRWMGANVPGVHHKYILAYFYVFVHNTPLSCA